MLNRDRLEAALSSNPLHPDVFEQCAQDLLTSLYPGLSPIAGGSDGGRDADIEIGDTTPVRLLVTAARSYKGVRDNLVRGLSSMTLHDVPHSRLVLANPAVLTQPQRERLKKVAREDGALITGFYDRRFFISRLRRDPYWRSQLLGISGEPSYLAHLPPNLAESTWVDLPIVGRAAQLEQLRSDADALVVGSPGAGKTRLVAEVASDLVFVDHDATEASLLDELRWSRPSFIAIDDAGRVPHLVRALTRFRRQETDYHPTLIAVVWPDEAEDMRLLLPTAKEVEVGLLEQPLIDQVVMAMGVNGIAARYQILEQSEGRVGWAVAITDLLLQSGWNALLTGKALLGQARHYLRSVGVDERATQVCSLVAMLGGADDSELELLAAVLGWPEVDVRGTLKAVARAGLIDVETVGWESDRQRRYSVRPPVLGDLLAAEHYFGEPVALGDVKALERRRPDRKARFAEVAARAASFGLPTARPVAERLIVESERLDGSSKTWARATQAYLEIDEGAARRRLRHWTEMTSVQAVVAGHQLQSRLFTEIKITGTRYELPDALELLVRLAVAHEPSSPKDEPALELLRELAEQAHPDIGPSTSLRLRIRDAACRVLPDPQPGRERDVFTAAICAALSPRFEANHSKPGQPLSFSLLEYPPGADQIIELASHVLPALTGRVSGGDRRSLDQLLVCADKWVRLATGQVLAFGLVPHAHQVAAARTLVVALLQLVAGTPDLDRGRALALAALFDQAGLDRPEKLRRFDDEVFFQRRVPHEDYETSIERLEEQIGEVVRSWSRSTADEIMSRLAHIKRDAKAAGHGWPDRVGIACGILAERDDILALLESAIQHDLFPEATPIASTAIMERWNEVQPLAAEALARPACRPTILTVLLESAMPAAIDWAVVRLEPADAWLMDSVALRARPTDVVIEEVLRTAPDEVACSFAIGITGRHDRDPNLRHAPYWPKLLRAVRVVVLPIRDQTAEYLFTEALEWLAADEPAFTTKLLCEHIPPARFGSLSTDLGHQIEQSLRNLPLAVKDELLGVVDPSRRAEVVVAVGASDDPVWLKALLDAGTIEPADALGSTFRMRALDPGLLAPILLPRGISPRDVAMAADPGSWSGERSAHLHSMLERFRDLTRSDDPDVRAVGQAGIHTYEPVHAGALEDERRRRIRGKL